MTLDQPVTTEGPASFRCNACNALYTKLVDAVRCFRGDVGKEMDGD